MRLTSISSNPDQVVAGGALIDSSAGWSGGVIMTTTNGGQSWQTAVQGDGIVWNVRRCAADPSVLYAAADSGLLRSSDHGQTWSLTPVGYVTEDVAVDPANCNDIYVMAYSYGPLHSTDGGQTFGPPGIPGSI